MKQNETKRLYAINDKETGAEIAVYSLVYRVGVWRPEPFLSAFGVHSEIFLASGVHGTSSVWRPEPFLVGVWRT